MDDIERLEHFVVAEHERGSSVEMISAMFHIPQRTVLECLTAAFGRMHRDAARRSGFRISAPVGTRACYCEDTICARAEAERVFNPDSPIEQRVEELARVTACTCHNLTEDELRYCFSRTFQLGGDCLLAEQFIVAYQDQCAAMNDRKLIKSIGL